MFRFSSGERGASPAPVTALSVTRCSVRLAGVVDSEPPPPLASGRFPSQHHECASPHLPRTLSANSNYSSGNQRSASLHQTGSSPTLMHSPTPPTSTATTKRAMSVADGTSIGLRLGFAGPSRATSSSPRVRCGGTAPTPLQPTPRGGERGGATSQGLPTGPRGEKNGRGPLVNPCRPHRPRWVPATCAR